MDLHKYAAIYDKLNNQPDLQELISTHFRLTGHMSYSPILEESDFHQFEDVSGQDGFTSDEVESDDKAEG